MSKIVTVPIGSLVSNPHRLVKRYPFNEEKIAALRRSIADVGLWEGVIARAAGEKYELAFGHHRVEAAKREKLREVPVIVRSLTDEKMLQLMGRENGEDYRTDFLVLLETWEAAGKFRARQLENPKAIDIARLLGWTVDSGSAREERMNQTGKACAAGSALIAGGHISRDDLNGLSVYSAMEILTRAQARMEQLERLGSKTARPHAEIEQAKRHVAKGARETARQVKDGRIAQRDIRGQVDVNAYKHAKGAKHVTPLFAAFGKTLGDSLDRMLSDDSAANRLQAIVDSLDKIALDSDRDIVARVAHTLGGVSERALRWQHKISKKPASVTKLKLLEG